MKSYGAGDVAKRRAVDPLLDALKSLENRQKLNDLILDSLAEDAIGLIKDGFRTQTDPYGEPWAPKKYPDGRMALSGETSRLKNGWKPSRRDSDSVTITPSVDYAHHHQSGTGIYGPRKTPIVSPNGKMLKIPTPKGAIFRRSVNGSPKRLMVPTEEKGLPPEWAKTFEESAAEAIAILLRGNEAALAVLQKNGTKRLFKLKVG